MEIKEWHDEFFDNAKKLKYITHMNPIVYLR